MEIVKRNIVLTYDELRILLFSQGYLRCEGVYMPSKSFTPEDIIKALKKLEENGLLTVDDSDQTVQALPLVFADEGVDSNSCDEEFEEFYIRSDLLDMIRIVGSPAATEILQVTPEHNAFCYIAENGIVTSESCHGRRDCIRLSFYTAEDFYDWKNSLEEVSE